MMEADQYITCIFLLCFGLASPNCPGNSGGMQERYQLIIETGKSPTMIAKEVNVHCPDLLTKSKV